MAENHSEMCVNRLLPYVSQIRKP